MESTARTIKLPHSRLSRLATSVLQSHPLHNSIKFKSQSKEPVVCIVCISDTHNTQPTLPNGDILIHAGDLTENGSFAEVQSQVKWLNSQPYQHKIIIAGNHDVLLDENFLEKHPERRYAQTETAESLDWGDLHYLQDISVSLEVPSKSQDASATFRRSITIFGSPWTPRYGVSAFQYPASEDRWSDKIPSDVDVIVTHGPPRLHLDTRDFYRAGCPHLALEIARIRPRLVVFGHIHAAYGREEVILDSVQQDWESIINRWAGWPTLARMVINASFARLKVLLVGTESLIRGERTTTFVNASIVSGPRNELHNEPIICIV